MADETNFGIDTFDNYIYPETHWTYGLERNKKIWNFLRAVLVPIMRRRLKFSCGQFRVRSKKYIVLANHATDYDPVMLGIMFPNYLRFVADERLFTAKPWGRVLSWLQNPIPWLKGTRAANTEHYIKTNVACGINVAMFPEGMRTMTGRTGQISSDIGRMIKESEGGLVTVRLTRGYMITPLWAHHKRKGPTAGRVVREYTREDLDEMTVDEINSAIAKDLYYNVWEDQENRRIEYRCSRPAEGLENALFICPACMRVGTMQGRGRDFICSCGYSVSVDGHGFFSSRSAKFRTLLDWDIWQRNYLAARAEHWTKDPDDVLCVDRGVKLWVNEGGKQRPQIDNAMMTLYPDRIQFSAGQPLFSIRLCDVERMYNYKSRSLLISYQGRQYEVTKQEAWPVLRYVYIWRMLTGQDFT